jgi:hypothetical protein
MPARAKSRFAMIPRSCGETAFFWLQWVYLIASGYAIPVLAAGEPASRPNGRAESGRAAPEQGIQS